jgi:hypothetical protein
MSHIIKCNFHNNNEIGINSSKQKKKITKILKNYRDRTIWTKKWIKELMGLVQIKWFWSMFILFILPQSLWCTGWMRAVSDIILYRVDGTQRTWLINILSVWLLRTATGVILCTWMAAAGDDWYSDKCKCTCNRVQTVMTHGGWLTICRGESLANHCTGASSVEIGLGNAAAGCKYVLQPAAASTALHGGDTSVSTPLTKIYTTTVAAIRGY